MMMMMMIIIIISKNRINEFDGANRRWKEVLWRFMYFKEEVIPVIIGATGIETND